MSTSLTPADPPGYAAWRDELKGRIRQAQTRAALSVNAEMIRLYWEIGRDILERQERQGWGSKVIDRLSTDLRRDFPEMTGFSARNLKYMRAFAEAWSDGQFVQRVIAQLPWRHQLALLEKLKDSDARIWYAQAAVQHGWSRNVLVHQIETHLRERQGRAVTNFARTLPAPDSELAQQILKDPYQLDFLTLAADAKERDVERGLIEQIKRFLLELGIGFCFVGSQYHLEVGGKDFYLDLLFYHFRLRRLVVIDVKAGEFAPEHAGKMQFYLAAVDAQVREPYMEPSIGLILCKRRNRLIVEYALRDAAAPIGVSEYVVSVTERLPAEFEGALPTSAQLEGALGDDAVTTESSS